MPRQLTKKQLRDTAYHEAGHAVVAHRLRLGVRRVTVVPEGDNLGAVWHRGIPSSFRPDVGLTHAERERIERLIMLSLAGPAAERRVCGRWNRIGASFDYDHLTDLAFHACCGDEEVSAFIAWLEVRTKQLLELHWHEVEAVAGALVERRSMTGAECRSVIEQFQGA